MADQERKREREDSPTPLPVGDTQEALTEFALERTDLKGGIIRNAERIEAAIRELADRLGTVEGA
tara:strand:+ start:6530 stop:6724 length:195 start_codon:yes stop_codon:yes gene_type:complete